MSKKNMGNDFSIPFSIDGLRGWHTFPQYLDSIGIPVDPMDPCQPLNEPIKIYFKVQYPHCYEALGDKDTVLAFLFKIGATL